MFMSFKMEYKIKFFLVLFLGCYISALGQNLCLSGEIKTKPSSGDQNEFPGVTSFEIIFNKGKKYESKFSIPCDHEDNYKYPANEFDVL